VIHFIHQIHQSRTLRGSCAHTLQLRAVDALWYSAASLITLVA
jgi:hypothetical protein